MSWTYDASQLGLSSAVTRVNTVRYLIGDTDSSDKQVQDEEIAFQLSQTSDDVYKAGSACCSSLQARYARLVDTSQDDGMLSTKYSQLQTHYAALASSLAKQSKQYGTNALGSPVATGVSIAANEALDEDTDRLADRFDPDQFRNP